MSKPNEPVANGVSLQDLGAAMRSLVLADVEFGTVLAEEGASDPTLMVLLDGEIEAVSGDVQVATVEAGAMLGVDTVFGGRAWPATFKATRPSSLLLAPGDVYDKLRAAANPLAWALERSALAMETRTLDAIDARIGALAKGAPLPAPPAHGGLFARLRSSLSTSAVSPEARTGRLRASELFRDAPQEAVERLAERMIPVTFEGGTVITAHGHPAERLYFVAQGRVDVVLPTGPDRFEPLATLEAGSLFGMASLLGDRPHVATVVAHERVVVYALDVHDFRALIGGNREEGSVLRRALLRALVAQNRAATGQLARLDHAEKARVHEEVADRLYRSDALGEVTVPEVSRLDKGNLVLPGQ